MFDTINNRVAYDTVGGLPLLSFATVNPRGWQFAMKHACDRVAALVLLIASAPFMLLAALAIRLTSRGPVLFRQRRVGRDCKPFNLYKFRSMRMSPAGERHTSNAVDYLLGGDTAPGGVEGEDRRTAIGMFLRRSSLDELPQLINVLRGDMALVGPRPPLPGEVAGYTDGVRRRLLVKPGMTGLWQVSGRSDLSWEESVRLDLYYVENWSLSLDAQILWRTASAVLRSAGAY
jgi:lipopolysaccharide/colanic/teichoic acid biosynthesis glycosyltransferase